MQYTHHHLDQGVKNTPWCKVRPFSSLKLTFQTSEFSESKQSPPAKTNWTGHDVILRLRVDICRIVWIMTETNIIKKNVFLTTSEKSEVNRTNRFDEKEPCWLFRTVTVGLSIRRLAAAQYDIFNTPRTLGCRFLYRLSFCLSLGGLRLYANAAVVNRRGRRAPLLPR